MGRYFQTADLNIEDYGYVPDYSKALPFIQKIDSDIQNAAKQLEILNNLPIEFYEDTDGENARRIMQEYQSDVNQIVDMAMKDPNNLGALQQAVRKATAKAQQDWTTGRVHKIQQNKQNIDKYFADIDKLKDSTSKVWASKMLDEYIRGNPQGALGTLFKSGPMYEFRNIPEEFLKSSHFKELVANSSKNGADYVNGMWIDSVSGERVVLEPSRIMEAFKQWSENEGTEYFNYAQRYGSQSWLDSEGKINWNKGSNASELMNQLGKTYSYSKTASDRSKQANPYYQMALSSRGGGGGRSSGSSGGSGADGVDSKISLINTGQVDFNNNPDAKNAFQSLIRSFGENNTKMSLAGAIHKYKNDRNKIQALEAFMNQHGVKYTTDDNYVKGIFPHLNITQESLKENIVNQIGRKTLLGVGSNTYNFDLDKGKRNQSLDTWMTNFKKLNQIDLDPSKVKITYGVIDSSDTFTDPFQLPVYLNWDYYDEKLGKDKTIQFKTNMGDLARFNN